jgi:hypothetical protein
MAGVARVTISRILNDWQVAFDAKLASFDTANDNGNDPSLPVLSALRPFSSVEGRSLESAGKTSVAKGIEKNQLTHTEPRRFRDKNHVKFVAQQPCLICNRRPSDAHHLRFAQHRTLDRKVSDEFTVPLGRGHHREAHRCGDEAARRRSVSIRQSLLGRYAPHRGRRRR